MDELTPPGFVLASVGPVPIGVNSFDFTCSPPNPSLLPSTSSEEILGVTVLILTASYRDKEFVRVGYYVNTEYEDEARRLEPPAQVDFKGLIRNVLVEKPRVTRFNNPWDSEFKTSPWDQATVAKGMTMGAAQQEQQQQQQQAGGGATTLGLDAPMHAGPGGDARDIVFQSPLPPPVAAAAAPVAVPPVSVAPAGMTGQQQQQQQTPLAEGNTASNGTASGDVDMS